MEGSCSGKKQHKKMDGIADWRKRRNGRWSQKKVKRKQIWNSQLGRNVSKKKKIGTASSEETSINGKK